MDINQEIYNIIEDYNNDGDIEECKDEIEHFLNHCEYVNECSVWWDEDVFDSPGLDIGYIAVSYTDNNNELHMCGSAFYTN